MDKKYIEQAMGRKNAILPTVPPKENVIYPYGEKYDKFLEYHVNCPQCGKLIKLYIPEENVRSGYHLSDEKTCHMFLMSIDRGRSNLYAHKVIHLAEDMMGGTYIDDLYHLYPVMEGENSKKRQERLLAIQMDEYKDLMADYASKKEEIICRLCARNDRILHALRGILERYEQTAEDKWTDLDQKIDAVTESYDAIRLLRDFDYQVKRAVAIRPNVPSEQIDMNHTNISMNSFAVTMNGPTMAGGMVDETVPKELPGSVSDESLICSCCGAKVTGKFCQECGTPRADI